MTDRVDAAVHRMQGATLDPASHRAPSDSHLEKLPAPNDPVLILGQLRDPSIGIAYPSVSPTRSAFGTL